MRTSELPLRLLWVCVCVFFVGFIFSIRSISSICTLYDDVSLHPSFNLFADCLLLLLSTFIYLAFNLSAKQHHIAVTALNQFFFGCCLSHFNLVATSFVLPSNSVCLFICCLCCCYLVHTRFASCNSQTIEAFVYDAYSDYSTSGEFFFYTRLRCDASRLHSIDSSKAKRYTQEKTGYKETEEEKSVWK